MNARRHDVERCGGCGLVVSGGTAGCRAIFDRLAMPILGENPFLPLRRLIVDVYALQHPDPFCVSATSLAAHLTGAGWILEYGRDQIRRWLNSRPGLVKPPLLASYGDVTLDVVVNAQPSTVADGVDQWARST